MSALDELSEIARRGRNSAKHATIQSATTVAVAQVDDNGNTVTQPRDVENGNKIFVQLANDQARTVSVWNLGKIAVPNKEGIPVFVDHNPGGELEIANTDPMLMDNAYGDNANTELMPELTEALRWIVEGWNLKPLRVRQAPEYGGLNVIIEDGVYEYAGGSYAWLDKTPIDLATISVSSGMKRPVIIGIDPATNTAITAYGDEVANTAVSPKFTKVDYVTVRNDNPGKVWLYGYEHKNGKTAFSNLYDLEYIAALYNPTGIAGGGGGFMPINLDYELTIPANQQTVVDYMTTSGDGALINYGIVRTA